MNEKGKVAWDKAVKASLNGGDFWETLRFEMGVEKLELEPEPHAVRRGPDGKPAIGPFVRQMARFYEVTPEELAERIGGEPEGLILEPGEDERVEWLHDRVRRSTSKEIVLVEGPDGFKALRVLGRWTNQPPFKFTFGDAEKLVDIPKGSFEHATLAREARLALSKSGA